MTLHIIILICLAPFTLACLGLYVESLCDYHFKIKPMYKDLKRIKKKHEQQN